MWIPTKFPAFGDEPDIGGVYHRLLGERYNLEPEPKPSVETFVRTRAEYAEKETDALIGDLRDVLFEMQLDLVQGHVFRLSTERPEAILAEIKSLLERRWNDEKIIEFIEQNDLT